MKVLVANPPAYLYDYNRRYIQGGSRWSHSDLISQDDAIHSFKNGRFLYTPFPFFLAYAASHIEDICNLYFFDGVVLNYNEMDFKKRVAEIKPDLLVLEAPTVSFDLILRLIRDLKRDLDFKVAIVGFHITARFREELLLHPEIDFALINEFEYSLHELVKNDLDPTMIKGIAFVDQTHELIYNGSSKIEKDLTKFKFPYRDDSAIYYDDLTIIGHPNIQMLTSRGCPVGCNFCYTTTFYENSQYRARNPEDVANEINYLKDRFHPKQFYFDDDTISINQKHITDLCNYFIKENLDIQWTCMADITIKKENLELMKKAGCVGLKFGVESIDPKILKTMHKGIITENKTMQFRNMLKSLNIWGHATFSLGHPGDSYETMKNTLKFIEKLNPDSLQVSCATPLPGTKFYENAKDNKWLRIDNFNDFDGKKGSVLNYPQLDSKSIDEMYIEFLEKWEGMKKNPVRKFNGVWKKKGIVIEKLTLDKKHYNKLYSRLRDEELTKTWSVP